MPDLKAQFKEIACNLASKEPASVPIVETAPSTVETAVTEDSPAPASPAEWPYNCGRCKREVTLFLLTKSLYAYRCSCGNYAKVDLKDYEKLRAFEELVRRYR